MNTSNRNGLCHCKTKKNKIKWRIKEAAILSSAEMEKESKMAILISRGAPNDLSSLNWAMKRKLCRVN